MRIWNMRELVSGEIEFVSGGAITKARTGSNSTSSGGYNGDGPFLPNNGTNNGPGSAGGLAGALGMNETQGAQFTMDVVGGAAFGAAIGAVSGGPLGAIGGAAVGAAAGGMLGAVDFFSSYV
jgi:hypothetical protein